MAVTAVGAYLGSHECSARVPLDVDDADTTALPASVPHHSTRKLRPTLTLAEVQVVAAVAVVVESSATETTLPLRKSMNRIILSLHPNATTLPSRLKLKLPTALEGSRPRRWQAISAPALTSNNRTVMSSDDDTRRPATVGWNRQLRMELP